MLRKCGNVMVESHGFYDCSYFASVYARVVCRYNISIIYKCRLAPTKSFSIPRLELLSCLLLPKFMSAVENAVECEVQLSGMFSWSDSEVALWWVK